MPVSNVSRIDPGTSGTTLSSSITVAAGSSILICVGSPLSAAGISVNVDGGIGQAIAMTGEVNLDVYETRKHFVAYCPSAGTYNVTVTWPSSVGYRLMILAEVPGMLVASSPGASHLLGGGAQNVSTGQLNLLYGGAATLVGLVWNQAGGLTSLAAPSGYTPVAVTGNELFAYKDVSAATGAYNENFVGTWSGGGSGSTAALFAFTTDTAYINGLSAPAVSWPLSASTNGHYLKDSAGAPFPVHMRTAWNILNLRPEDRVSFLNDTVLRGFNAINIQAPIDYASVPWAREREGNYAGQMPFLLNQAGGTWNPPDATVPTSTPYSSPSTQAADLTTPNQTYFDDLKALIAYCSAHNIAVYNQFLWYGWTDAAFITEMLQNGTTDTATFGAYIADQLKSYGNLIHMGGGDHALVSGEYAVTHALHNAFKGVASQASILFGAHWNNRVYPTLETEVGGDFNINPVYAYNTYASSARAAWQTNLPAPMYESFYEDRSDSNGTPLLIRRRNWSAWLNSPAGSAYGHEEMINFTPRTFWNRDTAGARHQAAFISFTRSIAWHRLVPSGLAGIGTLVTANRGTIDTSNAIEAAKTPEGDLFVAYLSESAGNPTLDLSGMVAGGTYEWRDPTNGATGTTGSFTAASGQAFTKPGANAAGDGDWVLLLTAAAVPAITSINGASDISSANTAVGMVGTSLGTNESLRTIAMDGITLSQAAGTSTAATFSMANAFVEGALGFYGTRTFSVTTASGSASLNKAVVPPTGNAVTTITSLYPDPAYLLDVYPPLAIGNQVEYDTQSGQVTVNADGTVSLSNLSITSISVRVQNGSGWSPFVSVSVETLPTITTTTLPAASAGVAYSQTLVATGTTPITWSVSVGSLPSGLSLNPSTGEISGTPTVLGAVNFTARATNSAGFDDQALSITVNAVAPNITTTTFPNGTDGVAYSQTVMATGTAPITWAVTVGTLPAGLSLNTSTGVISGTPTAVGTQNFTVSATNSAGNDTQALSLTIVASAPNITTTTLSAGTVGSIYSRTLAATGTPPITWSLVSGALPTGLSLSSGGVISGTPTLVESQSFTVQATNSTGSDTQALSLTISMASVGSGGGSKVVKMHRRGGMRILT